MDHDDATHFNDLTDKVYALEFALMALAKALAQADSLALPRLASALSDMADQLRSSSAPYPAGSPADMSPVAAHVESLHDAVLQLQSHLRETRS